MPAASGAGGASGLKVMLPWGPRAPLPVGRRSLCLPGAWKWLSEALSLALWPAGGPRLSLEPQTSRLPPSCMWGPCRRWVRGSPRADSLWPRHGSCQQPPSPGPLCGTGPSWGQNTYTRVDIHTRAASVRPGGPCTPTFPKTRTSAVPPRWGYPVPLVEKVPGLPHLRDTLLGASVYGIAAGAPGACWGLRGASRSWERLGGAGSSLYGSGLRWGSPERKQQCGAGTASRGPAGHGTEAALAGSR